ncbi:MAG: 1-deoxy-D-xylulose-5-phosphate synthase [Oscillospiraceae bacterium]|nr:1-deoxy-D-xylulose-5-phosphate synthase [Oscillospiraceae bacterium]
MKHEILESIKTTGDIKKLNNDRLEKLCSELRDEIINKVSETGGHLASNLGAVELTVALHYVFDSPNEPIIWDVGHQCYSHKILTGRDITGIRTEGGLSGFPKSAESEHDLFVAGHASTSISAALGIAEAKKIAGSDDSVIAVVGDGAFSGGMIFEAMNNAGRSKTNLIVVLNDNEMSISPNVGAMAKYLANIRSKESYFRFKDNLEHALLKIPAIGKGIFTALRSVKTFFKDMFYSSNTFEHLGFTYLGPVDGHDIEMLIRTLNRAKSIKRPVLVHINTVKGKGYEPAEKNPSKFHGVAPFYKETGELKKSSGNSFSSEFGKNICKLAEKDGKICAITAAMTDGTGLREFFEKYPERFFDVGIAEEHAMTFAAGLAAGGMKPVFAVYSTFLQRAYDQILHDASIEPKHVVIGIDRAGIVGGDGETHQGTFDVPILTTIPGITVYSPSDYSELGRNLEKAFSSEGVQAVRYPRDSEKEIPEKFKKEYGDFDYFKGENNCLIVTYGRLFVEAAFAAEETGSSVLKIGKIFPIEHELIEIAKKYENVLFFEESVENGSIAEHFGKMLIESGFDGKYKTFCVFGFVPHMEVKKAMKLHGLDRESMINAVKEALK